MRSWPAPTVPRLEIETPQAPTAVRVHDTASGELVESMPRGETATLYVCGITPYDATHLGHANTYLSFDLLHRVWLDLGVGVHYTQNVTDVDDPLLERARDTGVDWRELAEQQTDLFRDDMTALRIIPPADYLGATETIDLVVAMLEQLREQGMVYQLDDAENPDWYFEVTSTDSFMSLSKLDEAEALARFTEMGGDPNRPGKRNPLDCLVWMQARPGEPAWESEFGRGRPGWHIECTAIAQHHLGTTLDVQGGGADLVFPHHEMCAAQAQALTGEPFAEAYLHSGLVALHGEKMSKSKGNLELVSRLREQGGQPAAIRLAMLGHHWREHWEWGADQLDEAQTRLGQWRQVLGLGSTLDVIPLVTEVRRALRTDLDATAAIGAIDAWAGASLSVGGDDTSGPSTLTTLVDALLGIDLRAAAPTG